MTMYVKVRVEAGARRERVEEVSKNSFRISVREPAEDNAANRRVRELIAAQYGVSLKAVKIFTGHRSPSKLLAIRDV